ncbi:MAG: 3-oxoadipate enol-lactonase [Deltaproteobacteria bacterium]|nr:3-oxoadipate enol-lactonase [Deltaproteobacteria bacterium]
MPFLQIDGYVHHYEIDGGKDKPALLFANSLGGDLRIWDGVASRLLPHFRIVRYDLRGHGLTEAPPPPYSADDLARDVGGLLDALEINDAIICGVSVGGMIAQAFAVNYPARARALVLCDTGAKIATAEAWQQRIDKVRADGVASLVQMTMERWFCAGFRERCALDVRGYSLMLRQTSPDGYVGTCAALRDTDLRQAVTQIKKPTLVLCGAEDIGTPPELGRELAGSIPGAQFCLIDKAAHLPCIEQPAAVAERMMEFFREVKIV